MTRTSDEKGYNRRTAVRIVAGMAAGASSLVAAARANQAGRPVTARTAAAASKAVVETTSGRVRGFVNRGVSVFLGIPYGATTTGANRFMPPVKPEPWPGVRNCLTYGHWCPQGGTVIIENDRDAARGAESFFLLHRTGAWTRGEDCLRLNVWTAGAGTPGRKRPVMVYMHGGFFLAGAGNDLLSYDGENLARHHDVVVVTHNHRLNLFGYLNLAEIGGERYAGSGNVGMLDIVSVLEWVRDNIANFGGDPDNVMIYGQSGGGRKVCTLMAMPAAKGLFHKAAVQSGSDLRSGSAEDASRQAAAVIEELNLSKPQLEKIHSVPVSTLLAVQSTALRRMGSAAPRNGGRTRANGWGPIVDGKVIPAHPFDPMAPEISAHVPMLVGTCLNENVNGCDNPDRDTLTDDELMKRATQRYAARARDIVAAYRREYPQESPFGLWAAISAEDWRQEAITLTERKAAQGAAPVYQYVYEWRTPVLEGKPGTFHSSEIAFVFDNADLCTHYSGGAPEALALSSKMGEAWATFARTGKPGHRAMPEWPAYTLEKRATMVLDNPCRTKAGVETEGLRLIRQAGVG